MSPDLDIRDAIAAVRADGKQRRLRCPGHDDRRASLSVSAGRDGRVLVNCFAGCTIETVVSAAGLTTSDLFARRNGHNGAAARIVATYDYTDEQGQALYQVVRLSPKDFRQR